jgi:hypothetical protein
MNYQNSIHVQCICLDPTFQCCLIERRDLQCLTHRSTISRMFASEV